MSAPTRSAIVLAAGALALVATMEMGASTTSRATQATASDNVGARAERARLENRSEEAIGLYRQALAARPRWAEGWFNLGTLLYERDDCANALAAFEKATTIDPKAGTAWAMRGLCEFKLGHSDEALVHIQRGRKLGLSGDAQFRQVLVYHEGLLLLGKGEFERAQETLGVLAADGIESDDLAAALGRAVLRERKTDVSKEDADAQQRRMRAGRAECLAAQKKFDEAERGYEQLASDFPRDRNVYYALGRHYVASRQPEKAVSAFEHEIANSPDHVPARLGIAAIKSRSDPATALKYAEEAVTLNPRIPLGHFLLGSLLLQTPQITRAISELEIAERSVRDDPSLYYALGRAYARAGRTEDAAKARAEFKRLTEARQQAARRTPDAAEPPK
jgi:tetratricopeptide (TPR) repeat protein